MTASTNLFGPVLVRCQQKLSEISVDVFRVLLGLLTRDSS